VTDSSGEYTCDVGDDVTFSIGTVTIGTIAAQSGIITPYSLFPSDLDAALNLARLLQSIDTDPNDDIIVFDPDLVALLPDIIDFSSETFVADLESDLGITLVSVEEAQNSLNDTILVAGEAIPEGSHIPVAEAGNDQNITTTATVYLTGSESSDADGDTLTYSWSITSAPDNSSATLSNTTVVNPNFDADEDGTYVIQLIVNDGTVNSAEDTVTITATTENAAPVADAGEDQNVTTTDTVYLNGSESSDADGDDLTYIWSITTTPDNSSATLSNTTVVNPTFDTDEDGTYVIQLIVNDGTVNSAADTVTITATTENAAPVADAGEDQNVTTTDTVYLNGSESSDADGDDLTYSWSITTTPPGSSATLSNATLGNPTFDADEDGTYVIQLIVNDGTVNSAADTVSITATPAASGITHNGTSYGTVTSPITGKIWLDRNLGAARVCMAYNDASCYGDYYQWGRNIDGHQSSSSATTPTQASNVTVVGHGDFITSSHPYDWGFDVDENGATRQSNWSAIDGSSVCPAGYRVPTYSEMIAETDFGWVIFDHLSAFNSFLKLPTGGGRYPDSGNLGGQGSLGYLWTSSIDNLGTAYNWWSSSLYYLDTGADVTADVSRGGGIAVRCIKD
jgi:hypothetical protein